MDMSDVVRLEQAPQNHRCSRLCEKNLRGGSRSLAGPDCFQFAHERAVRLPLGLNHHRVGKENKSAQELIALLVAVEFDRGMEEKRHVTNLVALEGSQLHLQEGEIVVGPAINQIGSLFLCRGDGGWRGRLCFERSREELVQRFDRLDDAEVGFHPVASGIAHASSQQRISHQLVESLGELLPVFRRNEQTGQPIDHQLGDSRQLARDNRLAAGHRFHDDGWKNVTCASGINHAGEREDVTGT
jgi:hypothetical protein